MGCTLGLATVGGAGEATEVVEAEAGVLAGATEAGAADTAGVRGLSVRKSAISERKLSSRSRRLFEALRYC